MRDQLQNHWIKLRTKPVERWLLFANMSFAMNVLMAIGKLLVGIYSASIFICVNALYNAGMALARIVAVRGHKAGERPSDDSHPQGYGKAEYRSYFTVGLILTATSIVYIVYSMRLFLVGDSTYYDTIPAITIATITFTEIGTAAYGISATRKYKAPAVSAIKMTNLTSALISLVLTQMAILSFSADGEVSFFNGLIGVLMGGIAALIGIGMMVHMSRVLSGRYGSTVKKKLARAVRKSRADIQIQPLRYEDHGPKARRLYVNVSGKYSRHELDEIREQVEKRTNSELICG